MTKQKLIAIVKRENFNEIDSIVIYVNGEISSVLPIESEDKKARFELWYRLKELQEYGYKIIYK